MKRTWNLTSQPGLYEDRIRIRRKGQEHGHYFVIGDVGFRVQGDPVSASSSTLTVKEAARGYVSPCADSQ